MENLYFLYLQISSNGYLTVNQRITSTSIILNSNYAFPILVPYVNDLDNRRARGILYRTTKDPKTLHMIDQDISLALGKSGKPSTFNASEAIIVTYNNVPRYSSISNLFKYQVVIATDYTNTFAILNYDRLDLISYHNAGFSEPAPCHNIIKQFTKSLDETAVLNQTSNVGRPGKHIHLLTVKPVKDCLGGK